MLTKKDYTYYGEKAFEYLEKAHITITDEERKNIEVADFTLEKIEQIGLELVVYVNTERCCAKELVLFPRQTCPEHRHPEISGKAGKEETFRCRYGIVYLYVEGEPTKDIKAEIPDGEDLNLSVRHEIILHSGEQYTIKPNTKHWFQAGKDGAVVSEFSTKSMDEYDVFTDKRIDPAGKRKI